LSVGVTTGFASAPVYSPASTTSTASFQVPASGATDVVFADVENPANNPKGSVAYPLNISMDGQPSGEIPPIGFALSCYGQSIPVPPALLYGKEGTFAGQLSVPLTIPYFPAPSNPPAHSCTVAELVPNGLIGTLTDTNGQDSTAGLTGTGNVFSGPLTFVPGNTGTESLTVADVGSTQFDTVANVVGSGSGQPYGYSIHCVNNGVVDISLNTPAQPVSETDPLAPASTTCTETSAAPATVPADLSGPPLSGPPPNPTTTSVTFALADSYATGAAVFTTAFPAQLIPTTINEQSTGGGPFGYTVTCGNATFLGPSLGGDGPSAGALHLPASTDCVAQESGAPAAVSVSVSGAASVGANNGSSVAFETPPAGSAQSPVISFSNFSGPTVQLSVTEAWVGDFQFYSGNAYTFVLTCTPSGGSPVTFGVVPITLTQSPVVAGPSTTNVPANAQCTITQSRDSERATVVYLTDGTLPVNDTGSTITFTTPTAGGPQGVAFVNEFVITGDDNVDLVIGSSVTGKPPAGASAMQFSLGCTVAGAVPLMDIPLGAGEIVHTLNHSDDCTVDQLSSDGAQSTNVTVAGGVSSSSTVSDPSAKFTIVGGRAPVTVTVGFAYAFPAAPPPATTAPPPVVTTTSTTASTTTTSSTTSSTTTTLAPTTTTAPPTTTTTAAPVTPAPPAPSAPGPQPATAGTIEVLLQTVFAPKPSPIVHAAGLGSAAALLPPGLSGASGSTGAPAVSRPGVFVPPGSSGGPGAQGGPGLPGQPLAAPMTPAGTASPTGRDLARAAVAVGGGLLLVLLFLWRRRSRMA
ncbi:MAG TPA: hypothetical protein VGR90_05455, partial [Acidimicrobiales bacterium]|nr:hypothetical protein [Acidimicrobiales bacterium]